MTRTFDLQSPKTGTEYVIHVDAPDPGDGPVSWPAVFFLDGDDQFEEAARAYHAMRFAAEIPDLLLVGVGYGASYTKPGNKRLRDYTPTAMATEPDSGGADAFLSFLTDTLWPAVAAEFPVDEKNRGLAGHSLGSLLVLHALFQSKPFFRRHLASAPSIWWDDRSILRHATALRERQTTLPATLFLSVGTEDTDSMTGDLALLEAQLVAQPFRKLDLISRRFVGRDHYNVLPDAFRAGLKALFA